MTTLLYDVKTDGVPEVGKTIAIVRTTSHGLPAVNAVVAVKAPVKPVARVGKKKPAKTKENKKTVTDNLKLCPVCLTEFIPKRSDAVFCSGGCRVTAFREQKQGRMI